MVNTFPYPKNEISYLLWNRNPYEISRGGSDRFYPGTCFSYPYWLARWNIEKRPSSPPVESTTTGGNTNSCIPDTTVTESSTEEVTTTTETLPTTPSDPITT